MSLFSPSGLRDSSVHPAEGHCHREATVDLQPLRYQQRRIHQQRGECLCPTLIILWFNVHCVLYFYVDVSFVRVFLCFTGDDRHRQGDIRHDGEVHLPRLEKWRTQAACGCLLSGSDTWVLLLKSYKNIRKELLVGDQVRRHLSNTWVRAGPRRN